MRFPFYRSFIQFESQQVVDGDVMEPVITSRDILGIIANWLITRNTIPLIISVGRGMISRVEGCVVDFRHTPPRGSVQDETKWWNNGIIRWLDWWHNKRLNKLITDCDVIAKLWLHLLSASRKSLRSPTMKTSATLEGRRKHIFHSIQL